MQMSNMGKLRLLVCLSVLLVHAAATLETGVHVQETAIIKRIVDTLLNHLVKSENQRFVQHQIDMKKQEKALADHILKIKSEIQKEYGDDIATLVKSNEALKKTVEKQDAKHTAEIQKMKSGIEAKHAADITAMNKKLTAELMKLSVSFGNNPVIGFQVATTTNANSQSVTLFNKVIHNYGNGWNPGTHKFTAPTRGFYSFTFSINSGSSTTFGSIMRGGTILQSTRAYTNNYSGTATAVIMLNAGEEVYCSHTGYLNGYSSKYFISHFVGFLIQKI